MDEKKGSPIDLKTFAIILIIPIFFWGWSKYMTFKYPNSNQNTQVPVSQTNGTLNELGPGNTNKIGNSESGSTNEGNINSADLKVSLGVGTVEEKFIYFSNGKVSFKISNIGMGIKDYVLMSYTDREGNNLRFGSLDGNSIFPIEHRGKGIVFDISDLGGGKFRGISQIDGVKMTRELSYDESGNFFISKIFIDGPEALDNISFHVSETIRAAKNKSIFFPSYEKQDYFVRESGKSKSLNFSESKENHQESFQNVSLAGISSQYFTTAALDKSDIIPDLDVQTDLGKQKGSARLLYKGQIKKDVNISQILYIGPKGIDQLKAVSSDFSELMDFGIFGFIARPMMYLMKALYSVVGNWGIAIILLTLLVRFFVLPFNIMSYKSMKAMQKIQPLLTSLRERYKEDPVTLNKEMYALMKEHKANPMGGCLPMLLQIPVFFALFRVIGSSVELYKSPFFGWIFDLSSKDPYYIFPVLMGITMFVQQKLTPTNMDPSQAKIMAFMPLIFSAFMFQMPSGLTLYMFVSGLFGITQQYLFMRDKKA